jgi:predicted NUDIX family NTP pyrophosphohydrolase
VPKGELEEGEELLSCALRELREELGQAPDLATEDLVPLGSVRQRGGKVVHVWAAEADFDPADLSSVTFEVEWPPRSGRRRRFPEVDRVEWFEPGEARRRINAAQAELIDRLLERL